MTNPLHSAHFADRACWRRVDIVENVQLARDTFRLRFECAEMARRILPGQFLMLRLAGCDDPLLGRPLALFDTALGDDGSPVAIDVVYLVLGKMTRRLAACKPGQALEVWGPLGNDFGSGSTERSFGSDGGEHLVMVAGGIGVTPFVALAREQLGKRVYGDPPRPVKAARRVTLCYGVRSSENLAALEDFRSLGVDVRIATDDGSRGHHGFVTDLLADVLKESPAARVVCCGPEPMMHRVSEMTAKLGVACQVSLETPMACGIGICFSCVARVKQPDGGWDYRRTCVEGPIFDGASIDW